MVVLAGISGPDGLPREQARAVTATKAAAPQWAAFTHQILLPLRDDVSAHVPHRVALAGRPRGRAAVLPAAARDRLGHGHARGIHARKNRRRHAALRSAVSTTERHRDTETPEDDQRRIRGTPVLNASHVGRHCRPLTRSDERWKHNVAAVPVVFPPFILSGPPRSGGVRRVSVPLCLSGFSSSWALRAVAPSWRPVG